MIKPLNLKNKKAQEVLGTFGIFNWMIVAFLCILLFGGLIYIMGLINGVFHEVGVQNDNTQINSSTYVNLTLASDQTFGVLNNSIQSLYMVAGVYILALAVALIVTATFEKKHPFFFFIYVLIALLAVIFSAPLSNSYQSLLNSDIYGGNLAGFTIPNVIMNHLPLVVAIISILGGAFLFFNLIRGDERSL